MSKEENKEVVLEETQENAVEEVLEEVVEEETSESMEKAFKSRMNKKKSKAQTEFDDLKEEYEKMQNFALRTKADLENIKKRNENIAREMYQDGKSETLLAMLPVLDNITRAMALDMPDTVKEGIAKIKKQFDMIFEKMGVTEIIAQGEKFDPNFHTALMQVENPEHSGEVVQVYEAGYKYKDKILRHSSVVVAK